jgi:voltage-gated potassium channel
MLPSRDWIGAQTGVALTAVAALLSVATGLASIGAATPAAGPLAELVPAMLMVTTGFTGTITGFLLLITVFGLRRRLRVAWYAAIVLLPLTAVQGLLQARGYSLPLVVVSLLALVVLLLNDGRFRRELEVGATQLAAVTAVIAAQAYGTVGTYALRENFTGVASLTDAFYFTLVTGSTVGYGDVTPTNGIARWFTMSALLLNVASFAVALGVVIAPAIEARLSRAFGRMTETQLQLLDNHVLVLGYGDLTEPLIDELISAGGSDFAVVTPDEAKARLLADREVEVLTAEPSDESPLMRAQIESARAVVAATNDDAEDALSILTARQLNPEVRIVAAATQRENVPKLKHAGADTVISPATIGGRLLVRSALGSDDTEDIAERLLSGEE